MPPRPGMAVRGEAHHKTKLTTKQVIEIRSKYSTGLYSYRMLAREYPASSWTIGQIVHRKVWRHV